MLTILKKIIQEVTRAEVLTQALDLLVERIRQAMNASAVSVFLIDNKQAEYVLIATDGLNQNAKHHVRISIHSGLIGLVGQREEPIQVENAPIHPQFHQNPFLGEDHLKGFLGMPIIQHRKLYGVIVAQQDEARYFDDDEEAFLITLTAQLGGMIAHADATGELATLTGLKQSALNTPINRQITTTLTGIPCVPGIAIGTAVLVYPPADIDAVPRLLTEDIAQEIGIFLDALRVVREDIQRMHKRMHQTLPDEERALFEVYERILDQDNLGAEVVVVIETEQLTAQAALASIMKKHITQIEALEDTYLRERASDLRDLGRRVLAVLQRTQRQVVRYPRKVILIGEEVSAAALAEVPEGCLVGLVSGGGASYSHVAILARALGVPAVMGVRGLRLEQMMRRTLIVDGFLGQVITSPSRTILAQFKKLAQHDYALNQSLISLRDKPAITTDNHRIGLQVNIGMANDTGVSMRVGAEGVGLYRSEILFMSRDCFPSEDEQTIIYRQVLKAFAPHPVTMRTLDIGGDKLLSYFPIEEKNPYLGWRGIRVTLDHPEVFLIQIRAMIRASENLNNLQILLPMVTALSEVTESAALITQAYQELLEEGCAVQKPKYGAMIEVPALVYLSKELAKYVDFISVGSNDLTQYLLAVDRNNLRVASLYNSLHPALLRALLKIVEGAHASGISVSICGEMASDPLAVILLIAIGFDSLSMNSMSLPRIKWLIRNISLTDARRILSEVLALHHTEEIQLHLQQALEAHGLAALIYAT